MTVHSSEEEKETIRLDINWHVTANIRVMADYAYVDSDDAQLERDLDPQYFRGDFKSTSIRVKRSAYSCLDGASWLMLCAGIRCRE